MDKGLDRDARIPLLLKQWQDGDRNALAELMPIVYRELHSLAQRYMRRERRGHTLQATALVNEAFMRLGSSEPRAFADHSHFYLVAARLMRHILLDHAKARARKKRGGGGLVMVDSDEAEIPTPGGLDMIEVDDGLRQLEKHSPKAAQALELHYFGGMTAEETAAVLGISIATVNREMRFARAWLMRHMNLSREKPD